VQRHAWGEVRSLMTALVQISYRVCQWNNFWNRLIVGEDMDKSVVCVMFSDSLCITVMRAATATVHLFLINARGVVLPRVSGMCTLVRYGSRNLYTRKLRKFISSNFDTSSCKFLYNKLSLCLYIRAACVLLIVKETCKRKKLAQESMWRSSFLWSTSFLGVY